MITALDTSVILDILSADSEYLATSKSKFELALREGSLIICPVVWAELRPFFKSDSELENVIEKCELQFSDFGKKAASLAGQIWKEYRDQKGKRERMIPDFLVGAHAIENADRLLTRDRGFYRKYFSKLKIM